VDSKYKAVALVEYIKKYEDIFKKLTDYMEKNAKISQEKEIQGKSEINPKID
jgi:hypothetical protein